MKTATHGQIKDLAIRVLNLNPKTLDGDAFQRGTEGCSNEEVERRIIAFVNNGLNFVVKGPSVLTVDRTKPFNPAEFIHESWNIWRGLPDGDGLEGEEAQDTEALKIEQVDFSKAAFTACLGEGESSITGEEKLARHMVAGHTRLDAAWVPALFDEPGQVTLNFLYRAFGTTWFEFPGTVLRDPDGRRSFLCLGRSDEGRWYWGQSWLGHSRDAYSVSAVLVK